MPLFKNLFKQVLFIFQWLADSALQYILSPLCFDWISGLFVGLSVCQFNQQNVYHIQRCRAPASSPTRQEQGQVQMLPGKFIIFLESLKIFFSFHFVITL